MTTEHRIALALPALPEFLRVARITASGLASRLGFSIDDVDDLRLALDELCFAVIGKGIEGQDLHLTYDLSEDSLTISGQADGSAITEVGEFSRQILTALVDDHKLWNTNGTGHFELQKRRTIAA